MSNSFYNYVTGVPTALSRGVSALIRNEFSLIAAGFDLVYQQVFSSALPGIGAGTAGMGITNNGTIATWQALNSKPWTNVSGTSQLAVAGTLYMLTNVAATTLQLPPAPSANDVVGIKVMNGLKTNVIDLNSKSFEGTSPGTIIIDSAYACLYLQYLNGTWSQV